MADSDRFRKKTSQDYYDLAESRGFNWVGPEVNNVHLKTIWQCGQGHTWAARYTSLQQGQGCPHCADNNYRKQPADYHALATARGFIWLGPEMASVTLKTIWQCQKDHTWQAPFSSIQKGQGCPHCYGTARKSPQDYHTMAESRGFKWLGPEVSNNHTKTTWQCGRGHIWSIHYGSLQSGHGCPHCRRKSPEDYHALAEIQGQRLADLNTPGRQVSKEKQEGGRDE